MPQCVICQNELKFTTRPTLGIGKLSDGGEVCYICYKEIKKMDPQVLKLRNFTKDDALDIFSGNKKSKDILVERARKSTKINVESNDNTIKPDIDNKKPKRKPFYKPKTWQWGLLVLIILSFFIGGGADVPDDQKMFIDEWKRLKKIDDTSRGEKHLKDNRSQVVKWFGKVISRSGNSVLVDYKGIEYTLYPVISLQNKNNNVASIEKYNEVYFTGTLNGEKSFSLSGMLRAPEMKVECKKLTNIDETIIYYEITLEEIVAANKAAAEKVAAEKVAAKKAASYRSYSSSSSNWDCGWCGGPIRGEGWNTLMRIINQPANEYSHYCSRSCARSFLR